MHEKHMKKVIICERMATKSDNNYEFLYLKKTFPDALIVDYYLEIGSKHISKDLVNELLDRAKRGEYDILALEKMSRLARDTNFIIDFIAKLQKLGITIIIDDMSMCIDPDTSFVMEMYKLFSNEA